VFTFHPRLARLAAAAAIVLSGCYHTRVETGARPGQTVVDQPFALGFVYGIVPPPTVNTAERCPQGVAVVETQQTFLNGLVSVLTGGLVTPMQVTVTCAAESTATLAPGAETVVIAEGAAGAHVQEAFAHAADLAVETGEPVAVRFAR
jgi:hypothetical protein